MNGKSIRLIKRHERVHQEPVQPATHSNKWSTTVRSWVADFQERDREEALPAFDSLFKNPLPESGSTE